MSAEFPGIYRAQFLSVDQLGNVTCTVPAVTGDAPVLALSAGLSTAVVMKPGAMGWVMFEGGDPSMPVWVGFATPNPTGTTGLRHATVTSRSPFTILMDGVSYVNPARSQSYGPLVGDTVLVQMDGTAPYVVEATNRSGGCVFSRRTLLANGPTPSGTSFDVTDVPTFVAPVTGWVEFSVNLMFFTTVGSFITVLLYDNSSNQGIYGGGFGLSAAVQTPALMMGAQVGGGFGSWTANTWQSAAPHTFAYPCNAGAVQAPTIRIGTNNTSQTYWTGMATIKVFAA